MSLRRLLVRDYIHHTLYGQGGYFRRQQSPVGQLPGTLDFGIMLGEPGYRKKLAELYKQLQVSWVTPSALFSPHWGRAMARAMLAIRKRHSLQSPLVVYEDYVAAHAPDEYQSMRYVSVEISPVLAAAQRATVAAVPHATAHHSAATTADTPLSSAQPAPALSLEPAPAAAKQHAPAGAGGQAETTPGPPSETPQPPGMSSSLPSEQFRSGSGLQQSNCMEQQHGERFVVEERDAMLLEGWQQSVSRPDAGGHCFVLLMEVLDNLPHDRVQRHSSSSAWHETWLAAPAAGMQSTAAGQSAQRLSAEVAYAEELQPLEDRWIRETLECMELRMPQRSLAERLRDWVHGTAPPGNRSTVAWLPTGCLQLLTALHTALPQHTVIAADFTSLPEVQVDGWGAPIVSSQVGGRAVDHRTYIVPHGTADIFFPTDFQNLRQQYKRAAELAGSSRVADCGSYWAHTSRFMTVHAERNGAGCATIGGYNPLLEDFANTAVFVGSSHDKCSVCSVRDEC